MKTYDGLAVVTLTTRPTSIDPDGCDGLFVESVRVLPFTKRSIKWKAWTVFVAWPCAIIRFVFK